MRCAAGVHFEVCVLLTTTDQDIRSRRLGSDVIHVSERNEKSDDSLKNQCVPFVDQILRQCRAVTAQPQQFRGIFFFAVSSLVHSAYLLNSVGLIQTKEMRKFI